MARLSPKIDLSMRPKREDPAGRSFNIALDTAKIGAWELDINTNALFASKECKALFGVGPDEPFDAQRAFELIHPDYRDAVQNGFRTALENNTQYLSEYCITQPNGSVRWLSSIAVRDPGAAKMLGVTIDVTERKRARDILQQLSSARSTSERSLIKP